VELAAPTGGAATELAVADPIGGAAAAEDPIGGAPLDEAAGPSRASTGASAQTGPRATVTTRSGARTADMARAGGPMSSTFVPKRPRAQVPGATR
jgi:hypothetical protein